MSAELRLAAIEAAAKAGFEFWNETDGPWENQDDDTKQTFRAAAEASLAAIADLTAALREVAP
jgi:hypothetical protein